MSAATSVTVGDYLRWLTIQIGVQEKPPGSNLQPFAALAGHPNGAAWCATFLVAGAKVTGLSLPDGADTAYTPSMESAFKRAGRLSTTPRVGAFGFLYFPSMSRVAHVFVVVKVSADKRWIWTIEGNSNSDGSREGYVVAAKKRPAQRAVGQVGVRSYGMPFYREDDDMALSDDDIMRIWNWDGVPNQDGPKDNPNWSPKSMLSDLEKTQDQHTEVLGHHGEALARIEGQLTRMGQVASGTTPAVLDYSKLAKQVADELAARMKS